MKEAKLTAYFNWLGEWTQLNDSDKINGVTIASYINNHNKSNVIMQSLSKIEISTGNSLYYVQSDNLVWKLDLLETKKEEKKLPFELQDNEIDNNNYINW